MDEREFGKLEAQMTELKDEVDELRATIAQTNAELREVKAELALNRETNEAVRKALQSIATFIRFAKWIAGVLATVGGAVAALKEMGWWK